MILATCSGEAEAERIAHGLLENKLAACVNMIPIKSMFKWDGKLENESEILLIIKSVKSKFTQLEDFIKSNHSYDCPEIIALNADAVSAEYARWVFKACGVEYNRESKK